MNTLGRIGRAILSAATAAAPVVSQQQGPAIAATRHMHSKPTVKGQCIWEQEKIANIILIIYDDTN